MPSGWPRARPPRPRPESGRRAGFPKAVPAAFVDSRDANPEIQALNVFVAIRPDAASEAREYVVNLYQAPEGDAWIAESDELPVATEAATVDELIERVWPIAPEIAELNGHQGELNLRFIVHTRAA